MTWIAEGLDHKAASRGDGTRLHDGDIGNSQTSFRADYPIDKMIWRSSLCSRTRIITPGTCLLDKLGLNGQRPQLLSLYGMVEAKKMKSVEGTVVDATMT